MLLIFRDGRSKLIPIKFGLGQGFRPALLNAPILFNRGILIWPEADFSLRHYASLR
ncbi:MAG: hypothetical protein JRF22_07895 [Deltaproteobacteria bacterium]|nr:hypothetical protein [Deltaproteobacteria bacterium]